MKHNTTSFQHLSSIILIKLLICFTIINIKPYLTVSEERKTESINLGTWTEESLMKVMKDAAEKSESAEGRISFISEKFLGTKYQGKTLTGSINEQEGFTLNLAGMDCFTYIDYVEAMRLSSSFSEFKHELKKIRYREGVVSFQNRNHFFSDWPVNNGGNVRDVTREIGGGKTTKINKKLNLKQDETYYLSGIPVINRKITFLPSSAINDEVVKKLHAGDYVGIYAHKDKQGIPLEGLDVTHTGIIIKKDDKVYLRHASSIHNKVIDENFLEYVQNKPGVVIYRPID